VQKLCLRPWRKISPSVFFGMDDLVDLDCEWPALTPENTDHLTGLANRRAFDAALETAVAVANRRGAAFGLVLFDLDRFKAVNDTHGHRVGDAALTMFARVLKECVRAGDFPARYGGEEFAVIVRSHRGAYAAAERVRLALSRAPLVLEGIELSLTCSFGCAVYPRDAGTAEELVRKADAALYLAKDSGRNRGRKAEEVEHVLPDCR